MNRYMLILFEKENVYTDFSPEEMQKEIQAHMKWVEDLGDHYEGGEPLQHAAKSIKGKNKVLTDGPFIESKELISGYYLINASNIEEATELAQGCPVYHLGGSVEIREIMNY